MIVANCSLESDIRDTSVFLKPREICSVHILLEALFCLLKPLRFSFPRCFWHPDAEPSIGSVSSPSCQPSTPHLFLASCFLIIPFRVFFFLCITQEDGKSLRKQLLPLGHKGLHLFIDKTHHHAAVVEPTVWVFRIDNNREFMMQALPCQADPAGGWRFRASNSFGLG